VNKEQKESPKEEVALTELQRLRLENAVLAVNNIAGPIKARIEQQLNQQYQQMLAEALKAHPEYEHKVHLQRTVTDQVLGELEATLKEGWAVTSLAFDRGVAVVEHLPEQRGKRLGK